MKLAKFQLTTTIGSGWIPYVCNFKLVQWSVDDIASVNPAIGSGELADLGLRKVATIVNSQKVCGYCLPCFIIFKMYVKKSTLLTAKLKFRFFSINYT